METWGFGNGISYQFSSQAAFGSQRGGDGLCCWAPQLWVVWKQGGLLSNQKPPAISVGELYSHFTTNFLWKWSDGLRQMVVGADDLRSRMKHIGLGSWIPKRCQKCALQCISKNFKGRLWTCQCWIGSYAEGHVLSSASLWKQVWRGEGGQNAASTDILEKVGKRHTLIETILLHFWTFPLLCETPQIRTLVKNAASTWYEHFSDWSSCCLRTRGHRKVLNIPIYFLRKRSCYNVLLTFVIGKHIRFFREQGLGFVAAVPTNRRPANNKQVWVLGNTQGFKDSI